MVERAAARCLCAVAAFLWAWSAAAEPAAGLREDLALPAAPRLSQPEDMLRRLLSPLAFEAVRRELAASGKALAPAVDPAAARFTLYVPPVRPTAGYGLLVFVPPWRPARLPEGWAEALDRDGVIFVTPAGADNEENVLSRRAPLALTAYDAVAERYPLDANRVYVGGFSGGSRVALRLALAYPDVFRGALLNAGSDPIGEGLLDLPPPELFRLFQSRTRLVYATGARDDGARGQDDRSRASLRRWCVAGVATLDLGDAGHRVLAGPELGRALQGLARPTPPQGVAMAACRADLAKARDAALAEAASAAASGDAAKARRAILGLDRTWGRLVASEILALADRCRCGLVPPTS